MVLGHLRPGRLIYGSDWPNSDPWGTYPQVLKIVREYFTGKGKAAAEKFFWKNSIAAYRWVKRQPSQPSAGQLSAVSSSLLVRGSADPRFWGPRLVPKKELWSPKPGCPRPVRRKSRGVCGAALKNSSRGIQFLAEAINIAYS